MKRKWNQVTIGFAAAALVLTAGAAVKETMAYFSTYVTASGGHVLELESVSTELREEVADWTKTVIIANTGEGDCYVRVRAFAASQYGLTYSGTGWADGNDGYYYLTGVLGAKAESAALEIRIDHTAAEDDFNVIVVQECIPVPYSGDGEPLAWNQVDWTKSADVVKEEIPYGGEVES